MLNLYMIHSSGGYDRYIVAKSMTEAIKHLSTEPVSIRLIERTVTVLSEKK